MIRRAAGTVLVVALTVGAACSDDSSSNRNSNRNSNRSSQDAPSATTAGQGGPTSAGVQAADLATGLEVPWSVAFLPDGTALVSERKSGRITAITKQGGGLVTDATHSRRREVQRLPSSDRGEGGLLGLAVSPTYAKDKWVYAYYTTDDDNRVVRFQLGQAPQPILTGIPAGQIHNGGRLAFGPDGKLYVTAGETGQRANAQDLKSLGGKILRIEPDGSVPKDNPFPGSPIYSYGHRNVQGLDWTTGGQLYATEFGQNTWDEVNRIVPGGNYGWPLVEGKGGAPRFIDPITQWPTSDASPSGAVIPKHSAVPQWDGNFLLAGLVGQRLWRVVLSPEGTVVSREALFENRFGRLRLITQAPDGSLWLLTSNRDGRGQPSQGDDRIVRLTAK